MIEEAINRILKLATPHREKVGGLEYSDRALAPIETPAADAVTVRTLTGLVDLIEADLDTLSEAGVALHVTNHVEVELIDLVADEFGRRHEYICAQLPDEKPFLYGQFMPAEAFIIALQAQFESTPDRDEVLRICSNLGAENVTTSKDDGVSQQVAVKRGVVLAESTVVKPRVTLAPYRTFREIVPQIQSEFIFRLRTAQEGQPPQCALFEADGGKWKLDAMLAIKDWLKVKTADIPVIA